jgi:hypothetical protein
MQTLGDLSSSFQGFVPHERWPLLFGGGLLTNISRVVQLLKKKARASAEAAPALDEALAALGNNSNGTSRTISAAGRRRISLAEKARWAK